MNEARATRLPADPVDLAVLVLLAGCVAVVRLVLVPLVALVLTAAGWRPGPGAAGGAGAGAGNCPAVPDGWPALPAAAVTAAVVTTASNESMASTASAPLVSLPVRELRVLARAAGHRGLARSGRRADLLAVLA